MNKYTFTIILLGCLCLGLIGLWFVLSSDNAKMKAQIETDGSIDDTKEQVQASDFQVAVDNYDYDYSYDSDESTNINSSQTEEKVYKELSEVETNDIADYYQMQLPDDYEVTEETESITAVTDNETANKMVDELYHNYDFHSVRFLESWRDNNLQCFSYYVLFDEDILYVISVCDNGEVWANNNDYEIYKELTGEE